MATKGNIKTFKIYKIIPKFPEFKKELPLKESPTNKNLG
jgi:hypothetical protein